MKPISNPVELLPEQLRWRCDPTTIPFATTAEAAPVEIAGCGVMQRVIVTPEAVGRQRQHADDPPDPVVGKAVAEERAVATVVLDHEQSQQKPCRRHREKEQRQDQEGKANACHPRMIALRRPGVT